MILLDLLERVFRLTGALTLAGSLGVLLVLGGRAALRERLSPGWLYRLWSLPLVLFLVPFALPVRGGAAPQGVSGTTSIGALSGDAALAVPQNLSEAGRLPGLFQSLGSFWEQALPVLAWIWLLGLLFLAAVRLADHRALVRSLARCCCPPREDGPAERAFGRIAEELGIPEGRVKLLLCPGVGSPLLMGLFRPQVLLPREDYPEEQLLMMLRHELNHYKGRDLWAKGLALGVACIHWFNPLAWLLVRDLDRCCELRCDQRTTQAMTMGEKKQYGRMLLDVAQGSSIAAPSGAASLAMNREELKRRLTLLRSSREIMPLDRAVSLALALTVAVTGVVCSSAVNPGPVFAGVFQTKEEPPALLVTGDKTPPELWDEILDQPEEIPQPKVSPSMRMKAVLSDQVTAPMPEETEASAPEPAPETAPEDTPEPMPGPEEEPAPVEPEPESEPEPVLVGEDLHWGGSFLWPVGGGYVSAGYNSYRGHTGMDIAADPGTEIYAAAGGVVTYATDYSIWPYGKSVLIDHGDGMTTRYAHCKQVFVTAGEQVDQGQVIALVGRTGNATGNHCHFEVILDGTPQDPAAYIGTDGP